MRNFEQSAEFGNPEEVEITPEKGANILLRIKFIRHGERGRDNKLTDYGRVVTKEKAADSGLGEQGFNAIKAYGSQQGPKADIKKFPMDKSGMGRSMETAFIYTEEIRGDGDKKYTPRAKDLLNYETIKTKSPYNHQEVYNSNLPANYEQLKNEEKSQAARKAETATVAHMFSINTPEAEQFRMEGAGAFAKAVNQRIKMTGKLKSGSRVLSVEGGHSYFPTLLLKYAMVRKMGDGTEIRGFENVDEIGGSLFPSESIDTIIERDESGNLKKIGVELDPSKPKLEGEMYLDPQKLDELEKFYDEIHGEK